MKSTDLNAWQRRALKNKVRPMSEYLSRLRKQPESDRVASPTTDERVALVLKYARLTHVVSVTDLVGRSGNASGLTPGSQPLFSRGLG